MTNINNITEILSDPAWSVGIFSFDGSSFPMIRLTHPRFGEITWVMSLKSAEDLAAALAKATDDVSTSRMK